VTSIRPLPHDEDGAGGAANDMLCRRSHKHLFDDAVPIRADHDQVDVLFVGDTQNLSIRFARLDALIHAGVLARLPSYSAAQVALRGLGPRADMADAVHAIDPERQVLRHFDDVHGREMRIGFGGQAGGLTERSHRHVGEIHGRHDSTKDHRHAAAADSRERNGDQRARRFAQHGFSDRPEYETLEAGAAVRPHHNEIGGLRFGEDLARRIPFDHERLDRDRRSWRNERGDVPAEGAVIAVKATGELTMHGTTKTVTVDLQAKRTAGTIEVTGNIPIVFADYGIPNPSFGPISTEDHGELEFLLQLTKS